MLVGPMLAFGLCSAWKWETSWTECWTADLFEALTIREQCLFLGSSIVSIFLVRIQLSGWSLTLSRTWSIGTCLTVCFRKKSISFWLVFENDFFLASESDLCSFIALLTVRNRESESRSKVSSCVVENELLASRMLICKELSLRTRKVANTELRLSEREVLRGTDVSSDGFRQWWGSWSS